jgi:putative chitinase
MTEDQLKQILPRCDAALFIDAFNAACTEFAINTPLRQAAFVATIGHESSHLTVLEENLNYSADALFKLFPAHFPNLINAQAYARHPEQIANHMYANRGGNGDEASGDGWMYRGAGAIQLTFRDNQKACGDYFGIDLANMPTWLRTPAGAVRSAAWFWWTRRVNDWADNVDFDGVSDMVNRGKKTAAIGDSIGWPDRLALYNVARQVLAC